jgi:ATP-dependent RNA helicase DeaD
MPCVATDVAARGIDLPTLSLVVHVEIPRDAETLQHRSGRTGRAGKKGTAVLIVPYPRRRRVEEMLRRARINAEWIDAPSRESIIAQDRERLLTTLLQPVEFDEGDRELAERLLAERSAQDIAAMLVRAHRARLPEPEELIENTPDARRAAQQDRHRPGFEDVVWFRMNIGKRHNADPRWILPLLCRRGHITRNDIGAIRIGPAETFFQVPTAISGKFSAAVQRTAGSENDEEAILIEQSEEAPRHAARENRKHGGGRPGNKPHRKGGYSAKPTHGAAPYAGKKKKPGGPSPRRDG